APGTGGLIMDGATRERSLAEHANALVQALQSDDDAAAAEALSALAALDAAQLRARVARLAQVLHQRTAALPSQAAGAVEQNSVSLSNTEAVQSLDHVVELTEQAAHRTLDLVEQGRGLVDCLDSTPDHATACGELRGIFNELALSQSYQDLSGQILKRVRDLLTGLEQSLNALAGSDEGLVATGPGVPGVDKRRSSQDEADDLLAELGL
ncbi:MAG: protein phosphatase CheZ, partial [Algiphilus sp.]